MNVTNELTHPKYGTIHTITCEDKPWILRNDVASALHFTKPASATTNYVDPYDVKLIKLDDVAGLSATNTERVFINLNGVDRLAANSSCEDAEGFREWVHSELTGGADAGGSDMEAVVHDAGGNASNIAPLIFEHEEFGKFRITVIDGEPWFVGKDVALALGYSNHRDALARHVDDEDKGESCFTTPSGEQNLIIINESGLYSLILGSKLPEAKKFKRWITSEVLPSLHKYGMYAMPDVKISPAIDTVSIAKLTKEHVDSVQRSLEDQQASAFKTIMAKMDELQNAVDHGLEAVSDKLTILASRPPLLVGCGPESFDFEKAVEYESKHVMWRLRFKVTVAEVARRRNPLEPNIVAVYGEAYRRFEHNTGISLKEAVEVVVSYRRMQGDSEEDASKTSKLDVISTRGDWIAALVRVGIEMAVEAHLPYGEGSMEV